MSDGREEFRNSVLMDMLTTGPVPAFEWSKHAKQRARELICQGLNPHDLDGITGDRRRVAWSAHYAAPVIVSGDFGVPLIATADARVVAVTALPSSDSAWRKVYASGLVAPGRERRFQ